MVEIEEKIDHPCDEDIPLQSKESRGECSTNGGKGSEDERPGEEVEVTNILIDLSEDKVPDGGWGWMIVFGAFLVHALMGGFERSNGVFYLQFKEKFNRSATETAWLLSIFSTLRLAMGPVASALCNKFSCRFVVILGSAICTLGVLISAFMPDLPYLYLTYGVLGGVGRSFTYTPSLIIVGYYFNKKRGLAVGLATSGVGIGCFVFPPVVEIMFNHYGFEGTFLILTGVISNFFICGVLFRSLELHKKIMKQDRIKKMRKECSTKGEPVENLLPVSMVTRQQNLLSSQSAAKMSSSIEITANYKIEASKTSIFRRKLSHVKTAIKGKDKPKTEKEKKPLLELSLFKNFGFTALCLQLFLYTLAFNLTFVFLPALAKEKGISQLDGAWLLSVLGIFDGIARVAMSTVLDLKRVKPYRLIIYNGVMFGNAIVSIMLPSMTKFWHFAVMSGLFGLLSGTYISQKSVVVVDVLGVESLSSSFGLLLLFQGLSALIGPTVGGLFKDMLGSYDMAFYFGSIGIILGGLVMGVGNVWIYRQKRRQREADTQTTDR
ncbi:monocarboxylate transporter 4-like [Mya arenaria]|uniref:monocarboxylate transporter 4-like n=1 Tax=Mya arenaria TaxID=6604 RepID=UPI0022E81F4C|nr:monocarboxylate transporter 4-like [Mya arenaria]XP_052766608.1 monocarboxylate transporter 4-like [Mya arenaria]